MKNPIIVEQAANGNAPLESDAIPLTPDQCLVVFQAELTALMERYGVELVPYIITFNNGARMADAKFVPIQK